MSLIYYGERSLLQHQNLPVQDLSPYGKQKMFLASCIRYYNLVKDNVQIKPNPTKSTFQIELYKGN